LNIHLRRKKRKYTKITIIGVIKVHKLEETKKNMRIKNKKGMIKRQVIQTIMVLKNKTL
jgi:hypothetical protein